MNQTLEKKEAHFSKKVSTLSPPSRKSVDKGNVHLDPCKFDLPSMTHVLDMMMVSLVGVIKWSKLLGSCLDPFCKKETALLSGLNI